MTVKLELKPKIEAELAAQARSKGLSLEVYLEQVLQSAVAPDQRTERRSLAQLFAESPFRGLDLQFEREQDTDRPIQL